MTLEEIKQAVREGKTVHWASTNYVVQLSGSFDGVESFDIVCRWNGHAIGLTWRDGVTVNGKPEEFFIGGGMTAAEVIDVLESAAANYPDMEDVEIGQQWLGGNVTNPVIYWPSGYELIVHTNDGANLDDHAGRCDSLWVEQGEVSTQVPRADAGQLRSMVDGILASWVADYRTRGQ